MPTKPTKAKRRSRKLIDGMNAAQRETLRRITRNFLRALASQPDDPPVKRSGGK